MDPLVGIHRTHKRIYPEVNQKKSVAKRVEIRIEQAW